MYDVSFAKLSERFFKTTSWPPVHMIADLVDGDHVFCLLYKVQCPSYHACHVHCKLTRDRCQQSECMFRCSMLQALNINSTKAV